MYGANGFLCSEPYGVEGLIDSSYIAWANE